MIIIGVNFPSRVSADCFGGYSNQTSRYPDIVCFVYFSPLNAKGGCSKRWEGVASLVSKSKSRYGFSAITLKPPGRRIDDKIRKPAPYPAPIPRKPLW